MDIRQSDDPRSRPPIRRALVVGRGSIGERHARILEQSAVDVAVVSRGTPLRGRHFSSLPTALRKHLPEYVVVANDTAQHHQTLGRLAAEGYGGPVLVEKPLFRSVSAMPDLPFEQLFVGYNLRFHPALRRLKDLLAGERTLSVQVYAGQHLADWRPGRDYHQGYSARRGLGGGVLRDLSHELDYLTWLFGPWKALTAAGGQLSSLDIDCEDVVVALLELDRCPAAVLQLNYLDRPGRRTMVVNTDRQTYELDLVAGRLRFHSAGGGEEEVFVVDRDDTYRRQHRAVLGGVYDDLCTAEQGLAVLHLIEAIETASSTREWVRR